MSRLTQTLLTPRLLLRRWRPADAATMAAINADAEVTRYLASPGRPVLSEGREFVRRLERHWEVHGYGLWAVESREPESAGRLLGFAGLSHPTFIAQLADQVEIGWRLAPSAWGRGLATEASRAVLRDAVATHRLTSLLAIIDPENVRSRRVAEKLGMTVAEQIENPLLGREVEIWRLRRVSDAGTRTGRIRTPAEKIVPGVSISACPVRRASRN